MTAGLAHGPWSVSERAGVAPWEHGPAAGMQRRWSLPPYRGRGARSRHLHMQMRHGRGHDQVKMMLLLHRKLLDVPYGVRQGPCERLTRLATIGTLARLSNFIWPRTPRWLAALMPAVGTWDGMDQGIGASGAGAGRDVSARLRDGFRGPATPRALASSAMACRGVKRVH